MNDNVMFTHEEIKKDINDILPKILLKLKNEEYKLVNDPLFTFNYSFIISYNKLYKLEYIVKNFIENFNKIEIPSDEIMRKINKKYWKIMRYILIIEEMNRKNRRNLFKDF